MRRYVLTLAIATAFALPLLAHAQAQTPFVALAQNPGTGQLGNLYAQNSLSGYLNAIFKVALSVGAMLAVLRLVWGGYIYMVSGVGSFASQGKAKEIIGNAILGIVLLLAIFLILNQINPDILNLNITRNVPNSGSVNNAGISTQQAPLSTGNSVNNPTPTTITSLPQGCVANNEGLQCAAPLTVSRQSEGTDFCCPN